MPITVRFYDIPGRLSGSIGTDYQASYARKIKAEASSPHCGPVRILLELDDQLGIRIGVPYSVGTAPDPEADPPVAGDEWYEEDTTAFVTSIDPAPSSDDGREWEIAVQYGPRQPREANPLDEPPEIQWDREKYEEIVDVDIDGDAVQNSAGDEYNPPVTRDQTRPLLVITRNEPWPFPEDLADEYRDTVNDASFYGAPAGRVKCNSIKATRDWHQACGYFARVVYEFAGDRNGFVRRIRDQGFREIVSGARKQIKVDGQLATDAVALDGSGGVLPPGGTPVYRQHAVYPAKDFSVFSFPGS